MNKNDGQNLKRIIVPYPGPPRCSFRLPNLYPRPALRLSFFHFIRLNAPSGLEFLSFPVLSRGVRNRLGFNIGEENKCVCSGVKLILCVHSSLFYVFFDSCTRISIHFDSGFSTDLDIQVITICRVAEFILRNRLVLAESILLGF